jgi:hypothetical protein
MSKKVLDELIMRAVSDVAFRAKLMDPASFSEAISGFDLTDEEADRLRRVTAGKKKTMLPFAEGLNERLAK